MPISAIGRDALACALAFLPHYDLAAAARVSRLWHAAAQSPNAWNFLAMRVARVAPLVAAPPLVRLSIVSLHFADMFAQGMVAVTEVKLDDFPRAQHLRFDLLERGLEKYGNSFFGLGVQAPPGGRSKRLPVLSLRVSYAITAFDSTFGSLLGLPRFRLLETLEINCVGPNPFVTSGLAFASNLRRLVITGFPTAEEQLWTTIRNFKHLHTLEATSYCSSVVGTPLPASLTHIALRPRDGIVELLQPLRGQLQHLEFALQQPSRMEWVAHRPIFEFLSQAPRFCFLALRHFDLDRQDTAQLLGSAASMLGGPQPLFEATHATLSGDDSSVVRSVVLERRTNQPAPNSTAVAQLPFIAASLSPSGITSFEALLWSEHVDKLRTFNLPRLTQLSLRRCHGAHRDITWSAIARHIHLEVLSLDLTHDFRGIALAFTHFARLRMVRFGDFWSGSWDDMLGRETCGALARLPSLTSVELEEHIWRVPVAPLLRLCVAAGKTHSLLRAIAIEGTLSDVRNDRDLGLLSHEHPRIHLTRNGARVRAQPPKSKEKCLIM